MGETRTRSGRAATKDEPMPTLQVGDVVWVPTDAANHTIVNDLHACWMQDDDAVHAVIRGGWEIWRRA